MRRQVRVFKRSDRRESSRNLEIRGSPSFLSDASAWAEEKIQGVSWSDWLQIFPSDEIFGRGNCGETPLFHSLLSKTNFARVNAAHAS